MACIAEGLPSYGSKAELTTRLGKRLVEKKLGVAVAHGKKRSASDVPAIKMNVPKRPKKPLSRWQSFMKTESANIKASGITGLVPAIKELARRWKLHKIVNTPDAPLLLSDKQQEIEELALAIMELPAAEVNQALIAHGEVVSDSSDENAERLANALVVSI